jgi:hypothetical protein
MRSASVSSWALLSLTSATAFESGARLTGTASARTIRHGASEGRATATAYAADRQRPGGASLRIAPARVRASPGREQSGRGGRGREGGVRPFSPPSQPQVGLRECGSRGSDSAHLPHVCARVRHVR